MRDLGEEGFTQNKVLFGCQRGQTANGSIENQTYSDSSFRLI